MTAAVVKGVRVWAFGISES